MRALIFIALFALGAQAAEKKGKATPAVKKITLEKDVQPFFDASCVSCHIPGVANGNMILEEGDSYKALVGAKATGAKDQLRVVAGEPEKSYLLMKLKGTHKDVGGTGERMPMGGNAVAPATIELITRWISEGANEK